MSAQICIPCNWKKKEKFINTLTLVCVYVIVLFRDMASMPPWREFALLFISIFYLYTHKQNAVVYSMLKDFFIAN